MIITNTYFTGEIYLPHAEPHITDDVTKVRGDVMQFIYDYARECLLKSLGTTLFNEFTPLLDSTKANGLDDAADAKWNELLNGKSYTDPDGKDVIWRGIRFKSLSTGEYNRSFLANYVYFHFESNDFITRSDVGTTIEVAKNAEVIVPTQKVVKSWNKFVVYVQGEDAVPTVIRKAYGYGVDWFNQGGIDVSLYKFINDSNELVADTYADFDPKTWEEINQFGI